MLLRRVMKHVKAQDWFAVGVDFLIVVIGILLAFQITEWGEQRAEAVRSQDYLERIRADLVEDVGALQRHSAFWQEVAAEGRVAIRYAETGSMDGATEWEILRSFLHASQAFRFSFVDSTYSELRSAGELRLIPDAMLRTALAEYYVQVARRRGAGGPYTLLPDYRERVRGRMRSDVLSYYWQACFEQAPNVQRLVECEPPENSSGLTGILADLVADRAIIDDLRYWVDNLYLGVDLAGFDVGRANELIGRIDAMR